jgi:hypothetical protein
MDKLGTTVPLLFLPLKVEEIPVHVAHEWTKNNGIRSYTRTSYSMQGELTLPIKRRCKNPRNVFARSESRVHTDWNLGHCMRTVPNPDWMAADAWRVQHCRALGKPNLRAPTGSLLTGRLAVQFGESGRTERKPGGVRGRNVYHR